MADDYNSVHGFDVAFLRPQIICDVYLFDVIGNCMYIDGEDEVANY